MSTVSKKISLHWPMTVLSNQTFINKRQMYIASNKLKWESRQYRHLRTCRVSVHFVRCVAKPVLTQHRLAGRRKYLSGSTYLICQYHGDYYII